MKHITTVTVKKATDTTDITSFFEKIWKEITTYIKGYFGGGNS